MARINTSMQQKNKTKWNREGLVSLFWKGYAFQDPTIWRVSAFVEMALHYLVFDLEFLILENSWTLKKAERFTKLNPNFIMIITMRQTRSCAIFGWVNSLFHLYCVMAETQNSIEIQKIKTLNAEEVGRIISSTNPNRITLWCKQTRGFVPSLASMQQCSHSFTQKSKEQNQIAFDQRKV